MAREYISKYNRFKVFSRQNWKCKKCNRKIAYNKKQAREYGIMVGHVDHIHPVAEEDSYPGDDINELSNLQGLCEKCNLAKSANIDENFKPIKPFLSLEDIKCEIDWAVSRAKKIRKKVRVNDSDERFNSRIKNAQHLEDYAQRLKNFIPAKEIKR